MTCLVRFWNVFGMFVGRSGMFWGRVWYLLGTCLGHFGDAFVMCLADVWDDVGTLFFVSGILV